jgi:hypothetical protein
MRSIVWDAGKGRKLQTANPERSFSEIPNLELPKGRDLYQLRKPVYRFKDDSDPWLRSGLQKELGISDREL